MSKDTRFPERFRLATRLLIRMVPLFAVSTFAAATVDAATLYDADQVAVIELDFAQENWDAILDSLVVEGEEFRLTGSAVVNGISFDSVGVRYKGNSSYDLHRAKNPLNIKLDYIIEDQLFEGYGTLKLSNCFRDPSFLREVLGYEIYRKYTPASSAAFADVYVNGTLIGLYVNVQSVDGEFLDEHFAGDDPLYKGEMRGQPPPECVSGPPGVWTYMGDDSFCYEFFYELIRDSEWEPLIEFLDAFNNRPEEIEEILSLDRHLWKIALDILTVNLDGPVNAPHNFYLCGDETGRFTHVPWDMNEVFGAFTRLMQEQGPPENLGLSEMQELDPFLNADHPGMPLLSLIFQSERFRKMYAAHVRTLIAENFANGSYIVRAEELREIIDPHVLADPNKLYPYEYYVRNLYETVGDGHDIVVGIAELMDVRSVYISALEPFSAAAPVIEDVNHGSPAPYSETWVTAAVDYADTVFLARRAAPSDMFETTIMEDDGEHNDDAPGDGVYGAFVQVEAAGIQYYIYAENKNAAAFSPERAATEFYTMPVAGDLVINEFLALNDTTIADQDGEFDDWVELRNNSGASIQLEGFSLSDDPGEPGKWLFPAVEIDAGGWLVVWTDDDEEQEGLHANFKLSGSGESVVLSDVGGTVLDLVSFSAQDQDISTGRFPDGEGAFEKMTPTFAAENEQGGSGTSGGAETPSPPERLSLRGNYPNPFNPHTTIAFTLPGQAEVELRIYDVRGRLVRTLDPGVLEAGAHSLQWNGLNDTGNAAVSGVYICRCEAGGTVALDRMVLLR